MPLSDIRRESGACARCGATLRFRSLIAALTQRLQGKVEVLDHLSTRKHIRGIGMSDAAVYASRLKKKFDYTNTTFHRRPLLDIARPASKWLCRNDFVISSDVFEHVAPPIQLAFDNLFRLLKPGGVAVFSVPYTLAADTVEHYPDLHRFSVLKKGGEWILENVRRDGVTERFRDLVFHGGPGSTLEMRLFSLSALEKHFAVAGFVDFQIHGALSPQHGIVWNEPWGITLSAIRPAA